MFDIRHRVSVSSLQGLVRFRCADGDQADACMSRSDAAAAHGTDSKWDAILKGLCRPLTANCGRSIPKASESNGSGVKRRRRTRRSIYLKSPIMQAVVRVRPGQTVFQDC